MKLKRDSPELRRSPRLNPPPRRSPRIKLQYEREDDNSPRVMLIERSTVSTGIMANENDGAVQPRRSPRKRKTIHTPSPRRAIMVATPNRKPTMVTKKQPSTLSSKKKWAVKFGRRICVQNFNGEDPPSSIKRSSGKRLFRTSSESEESQEITRTRSKRIKNDGMVAIETQMPGHGKSMLIVLVGVMAMIAVVVGKIVIQW